MTLNSVEGKTHAKKSVCYEGSFLVRENMQIVASG